jgi:hypothetical protein
MKSQVSEKVRLLERLKKGRFNVPDFIYVPAIDFQKENFEALEAFLTRHRESYKVIARSAHPQEENFKSGTFDSLETYADLAGIQFARNRIIHLAETTKRLSIIRQQKFHGSPNIDLDKMGVLVMPYIEGTNVMAKMLSDRWEYGYCRDRLHKIETEPYITNTTCDRDLLQVSEQIQKHLGFRCEIEYVISADGTIHVVQAKDISHIETLIEQKGERSIKLDGVRRIRKRRNYRERVVYVMDNRAFYLSLIDRCEDLIQGRGKVKTPFADIISMVSSHEKELEEFALKHHRFGVLGLSINVPEDIYQIACHILDDMPQSNKKLSKVLHDNLYRRDNFLSESDTIIAKDKIRVNLCSHDAYGIDTVRNPIWSVYWNINRNDQIVKEFESLGFKTGDTIGIDIGPEEKPTVYRL